MLRLEEEPATTIDLGVAGTKAAAGNARKDATATVAIFMIGKMKVSEDVDNDNERGCNDVLRSTAMEISKLLNNQNQKGITENLKSESLTGRCR